MILRNSQNRNRGGREKRSAHRILAVALALAGVVVVLGAGTAAAQTTTAPDCSTVGYEGDGATTEPFEVSHVSQPQCIGSLITGASSGENFEQISDTDASGTSERNNGGFGTGFETVGNSEFDSPATAAHLAGTFDGNGHTIVGLALSGDDAEYRVLRLRAQDDSEPERERRAEEGCIDRRDLGRGQGDQECPDDREISRGESRDELDRETGRDSDTARRDRGRRNTGRNGDSNDGNETNTALNASDDSYTTTEGTALSVSAANGTLVNDNGTDGDTLSASLVSGPTNGTVSLATNGSFIYAPAANFTGTDTFTYEVSDGNNGTDTATVSINVTSMTTPANVSVTIANTNAPVTAGDVLDVTATVRNRGTADATQQLQLLVDGNPVTNRTITLAGGQRTSLTLGWQTTSADTGDRTLGVRSANDTATTTVRVEQSNPFDEPIPGTGAANPPTDTDNDGLFDDVNGDGSADFSDAQDLAFANFAALDEEQVEALDFDGDGDADFSDAIELAFSV